MLLHILLGDADRPERLAAAADILGFHVLFFKADQAVEQLVRPAGKARFMRKGLLLSAIQSKAQGKQASCRTHQLRQLIPAHAGKLHRLACQGVGTVHRKARIQRGEGLFDLMAVALQKAGIPQPGGSCHALQQASGALQQPLINQLTGLTHQRGKPGGGGGGLAQRQRKRHGTQQSFLGFQLVEHLTQRAPHIRLRVGQGADHTGEPVLIMRTGKIYLGQGHERGDQLARLAMNNLQRLAAQPTMIQLEHKGPVRTARQTESIGPCQIVRRFGKSPA